MELEIAESLEKKDFQAAEDVYNKAKEAVNNIYQQYDR